MTCKGYETKQDILVLSADLVGGFAAPAVLINHVTFTKIYSDGRTVFIDPEKGSSKIYEGHLDAGKIAGLFELLQAKGFFGFSDSYFKHGPTDMPTNVIAATRRGEHEKQVSCYGGAVSAPPGFMDCYHALLYPQIRPSDVKEYVRQPITAQDLEAGFYYGLEYQKKLDTPRDWVWLAAGRSSRWCKPAPVLHTVTLDSSYMIPPIDSCRHIRVSYNNDPVTEGSTIQFDRNNMSPNEFGDIGFSTKMYCAPQPATCALLETKDDERLFSVTVPGYSGANLRLVVFGDPAKPSGGRLLELDDHDAIQNIHWLQAAPQS